LSATVFYDNVNEVALLSNTFLNQNQQPADPTTVSCVVTDPSNTSVTHTYNGLAPADIVKVSTGLYTLSVPCSPAISGIDGLWEGEWVGTGAVSDVQPSTWRVLPEKTGQLFYCGLEELKSRLALTGSQDDYEAQIAIQAVSGWINTYCGQHFNRVTEARTFAPLDIWQLDIDPLVTLTAFNVDQDGDGVFEQAWTQGTDFQLKFGEFLYNINSLGIQLPYRKVQVLQTGKWFPFIYPYSHFDRVQITGTWGWPSVPPPVAQAALILSADVFKFKDAPFGVAGISDFGVTRIQTNPWLVEMLRPFINVRRKAGV